jgi:hypothetical protein
MFSLQRVLSAVVVLTVASWGVSASAAPFNVGEAKCADCHKSEDAVFKKTKHAIQFREIHRKPAVKDIITAAGGDANMRRNDTCTQCHFTMVAPNATTKPTAATGPSCESCHGPSSDWLPFHNATGDKAARNQKAIAAGMIRPEMLYDIATNCQECHGLSQAGIKPETIVKMIDAGHPAGSNFELVQFLEGTVRHRFYPPDVNKNSEMTNAEKARMFIIGHAAALVREASSSGKVNHPKFVETQKKIQTAAVAALEAIKGQVPEAATLLAQPTDENARKLVDAIAKKDLTAQVGSLLPAKNTYK